MLYTQKFIIENRLCMCVCDFMFALFGSRKSNKMKIYLYVKTARVYIYEILYANKFLDSLCGGGYCWCCCCCCCGLPHVCVYM